MSVRSVYLILNVSEWAETAIPLLTLDIVLFSIRKLEEFWAISTPAPYPGPSIILNDHDKVYIFEGPLNAFFTKNSIAVAGITERGKSSIHTLSNHLSGKIDKLLDLIEKQNLILKDISLKLDNGKDSKVKK